MEGKMEVKIGDYHFALRRATVADGLRRGMLIGQSIAERLEDEVLATVAILFFPSAVSAIEDRGNLPSELFEKKPEGADCHPGVRILADMPEQDMSAWLEAVYSINPHWRPSTEFDEKEELAKKDD